MSTSGRRTRRRANDDSAIGAPSADDSPNAQLNNPSSSAASTRLFPPTSIPSLTTLCIRVFASNVTKLPDEPHVRDALHKWLKALPESLVPRVFGTLRQMCPTRLSSAMITAVRPCVPFLSRPSRPHHRPCSSSSGAPPSRSPMNCRRCPRA
jgi:hypothetical protein